MNHVIIGAGAAGVAAAKEIAKEKEKEDTITLITEEGYPFYYRPRLIECLSGEVGVSDIIVNDQAWFEKNDIVFKMKEKAENIDPAGRKVITDKGRYEYDRLLLANGARAMVPAIKGHDKQNVFTLRTAADAQKIFNTVESSKKAVVVGGGLLGIESAYNLNKAGLEVAVLETAASLLPRQLDQEAGDRLQKMLAEKKLGIYLAAQAEAFSGDEAVASVVLADGREIEADLVLISVGVRPDTGLAVDAGGGVKNAVAVNRKMETNIAGIYAAGDMAEVDGRFYGIWPPAMKQGRVAGRNMLGKEEAFGGFVPSHTLKVAGIQVISTGELDFEHHYPHRVEKRDGGYRNITLNEKNEAIGAVIVGDFADNEKVLGSIKA